MCVLNVNGPAEREKRAEEDEDAQLSGSRAQTGPGLRCTVEGGPRNVCRTVHL